MPLCGRFTLLADELKIKSRFQLEMDIEDYYPSYNIAPGQQVLAIIYDGEKRRAGYIKWGLVPFWAKNPKIGNKMINARSETVHEKPSFKNLLLGKRCLIIADSFYEWKQTSDGKVPQRIQMVDRELFAFAGLWDKWQNGNETLFTCTMLTKDANSFMKDIHHRMPIILPEDEEKTWLKKSFTNRHEVHTYIQSVSSESMRAYPVSTYVNFVKNNDETCIKPIPVN